ncbi:hypothetical protein PoB_002059000 [Plakobranchus ocellatus]|uniref:Uncharacterized protein n=1 Tax=Plakobranchus ocellatus TaxID=259542 RepID=A0AAV3ZEQ6_9GAST|nr:hypothetical protein PoB_002059000 [Plakobranchus ocellatus]
MKNKKNKSGKGSSPNIHESCMAEHVELKRSVLWIRGPLPAPWPDGGPESLRSPCCGLAIYKKTQNSNWIRGQPKRTYLYPLWTLRGQPKRTYLYPLCTLRGQPKRTYLYPLWTLRGQQDCQSQNGMALTAMPQDIAKMVLNHFKGSALVLFIIVQNKNCMLHS